MTKMFVTYPGDAGTRFDRDYFVATHLPLVMEAWGPHGLQSVGAFFPTGDGAGTIAVAVCEFRDDAALHAALGSAESPRVMADVAAYTGAKPSQSLGVPPKN